MTQKDLPDSGVTFVMAEDGKMLLAVCEPVAAMTPIDKEQVNQILASQGFADLFIFAEALDKLVKQYNAGSGFTLVVGERRDGAFALDIDADLMQAHLTMTPACGGQPVSADRIYAALQEQGITFGILDDTIEASVAKGYTRNKLIAEGTRPTAGDDAQFISLLREVKNSRLHCDDMATVDYRNFGDLITVKPGDPLMRRLPASDGKPGTTILGCPVAAPRGNDLQYSPLISGTVRHKDDPDLLVAAISGQPFLLPHGVTVEPVITIKDVDLATGNLDVDGSLTITGDVKPGMRVKATDDIVIQGMVEAGHVEAGGDVEIRGAVIGQGEPRIGTEGLNPAAAMIRAAGSVKALFVENARITSGADIIIREFVMKSELNAGNSILVGESESSKGRIINSVCRAAAKIEAITIGSRSDTGTVLEAGADPAVQEKFTMAKQTMHGKQREFEEACKALQYFRDTPSSVTAVELQEKELAVSRLQTEIQELTGQLKRLKRRFDLFGSAEIKATRQIYSGVRIRIGEKTLLLDNDMEGATFYLGENGITF